MIQIAKAVAETAGRVESGLPNRKLAHIAIPPVNAWSIFAGALQEFGGKIDPNETVTSPGKLDGVTAVSARHIKDPGSGLKRQGLLQKIGFLPCDCGRHRQIPEFHRDTLKKCFEPL